MLNAVTAAPKKVAGPAILSVRPPHALSDFVPVGRVVSFTIALKDHCFWGRVAATGWKFFISTGLFMANQAVDLGLVREVKIIALPTIAGVT